MNVALRCLIAAVGGDRLSPSLLTQQSVGRGRAALLAGLQPSTAVGYDYLGNKN